ncbi:MAG: energy transducer TonB [Candidatus Sulfotelmatobacter sp.]
MATSPQAFQLGLLPERKIDRRAIAAGYTLIALATLLLINVGLLFPSRIRLTEYRVTSLIPLPALKPEHHEPVPEAVPAKPLKIKPVLPAPVFDRRALIAPQQVHHVPAPELVEAPKVVMNQFAAPQLKITASAPRPRLLHTGDFSDNSTTPTVNAAVQQVQTGGFGDPNGLKGTGKEGAKLYAAQTGSFDMPAGPGQGNGSGGAKGIKGTVASADFGNGIATGSNNGRGGAVTTGGFGSEQVVHSGPKIAQADSGPATVPVEITFKPNPVYTDEARNLKLEGEVLLEVTFSANGTLHVNRVVRGLGHGLDEAAITAANKMHFKPSLRMGQPVDSTAIVHVLFQMAY